MTLVKSRYHTQSKPKTPETQNKTAVLPTNLIFKQKYYQEMVFCYLRECRKVPTN